VNLRRWTEDFPKKEDPTGEAAGRMQAFFVPGKSKAEFADFCSLSMLSPCFDLAVHFKLVPGAKLRGCYILRAGDGPRGCPGLRFATRTNLLRLVCQ
jgi:hypothetical protein